MEYRVLVIDDEPWSRKVVKSLVEWEKLNLVCCGEADDAQDGLTKIHALKPHIVITDMRMPGMSGPELLREMEEQFPELKIIVLSGYDDFPFLKQAVKSGAVDYLLKPLDPDEINNTLEKCIKELQLRESNNGFSGSIIFSDSTVLDEYIRHRKRVFSYLLELDKSAVAESLKNLQQYLKETTLDNNDKGTAIRILHDFTLILEELTTRFGLDSQSIESLKHNSEPVGENEVFTVITKRYEEAIDVIKDFQRRKGSLELSEVKDHIDRYYQEQLSLDSVSKLFLVTKEHLSRAFKKTYGTTINEYITLLKMNKARELIVNEGVEIKQAAFFCGYTDLPYFYRVFKKHFGTPPGEMRN